jgi:hypothetical protein
VLILSLQEQLERTYPLGSAHFVSFAFRHGIPVIVHVVDQVFSISIQLLQFVVG